MRTAILVGLSIDTFDKITPYELSLHLEAHTELLEAKAKENLTMVWLGEYYHRTKKLPQLESELRKISSEKPKAMTDKQMLEMVKQLNAQFGGNVK